MNTTQGSVDYAAAVQEARELRGQVIRALTVQAQRGLADKLSRLQDMVAGVRGRKQRHASAVLFQPQ